LTTNAIINKFNTINKVGFVDDEGIYTGVAILIKDEIREKILNNKGKNELSFKYDKGTAMVRVQDQYIHCDDGPACFSKDYGYKIWFRKGKIHRLNGPAIILKEDWESWANAKLLKKRTWISNGKSLMNKEFPLYSGEFIRNCVMLSSAAIMNAMLIDREYGLFLKKKLKENKCEKSI